ncbi:4Fe-4S binding protein [Azonexus sp. R2A61]|uniref:4Fe-4S binding protein n=1 Tax=Azonexus sp. R2A61 TaxID=2744443 RepID=UPI001F302D55|nr:4Fe-4S binding protein [Azonexus sp. R2A61]
MIVRQAVAGFADARLEALGDWLQRRQAWIRALQWALVVVYYGLLFGPALLPQPADRAAALHGMAGFAEIVFWGLWWPAVILGTMLFGQFWCGVFCPDGALTEWASKHGRGGKIPAWMRWSGWPLLAFSLVVFYEHLVDAYQSPRAIVVTLGGASLAAVLCGWLIGRGKRVWCRYLCPAGGLFSLLARCAVLHFRVDRAAWDGAPKPLPRAVDCPLLLDVRRLRGNEKCSMCGRCSGHRAAVRLAWRSSAEEVAGAWDRPASIGGAIGIIVVLFGLGFGVMHPAPEMAGMWRASGIAPSLSPRFVHILSGAGMLTLCLTVGLSIAAMGNRLLFVRQAFMLIPLGGMTWLLGAMQHACRLAGELGFPVGGFQAGLAWGLPAIGCAWSLYVGGRFGRAHPVGRLPRLAFPMLVIALAVLYSPLSAPYAVR